MRLEPKEQLNKKMKIPGGTKTSRSPRTTTATSTTSSSLRKAASGPSGSRTAPCQLPESTSVPPSESIIGITIFTSHCHILQFEVKLVLVGISTTYI